MANWRQYEDEIARHYYRLKTYSAKSGVPMASVVKLAVTKFLDDNAPLTEGATLIKNDDCPHIDCHLKRIADVFGAES